MRPRDEACLRLLHYLNRPFYELGVGVTFLKKENNQGLVQRKITEGLFLLIVPRKPSVPCLYYSWTQFVLLFWGVGRLCVCVEGWDDGARNILLLFFSQRYYLFNRRDEAFLANE